MIHGSNSDASAGPGVLVVAKGIHGARRVSRLLRQGGVSDIVTVPDVEDACRLLTTRSFDLAIVDDRAIESARSVLLRRLQDARPGVAIITLTGARDARAVREALKAGATDCLTRDELRDSAFSRGVATVLEGVLRRRDTDWFHKDLLSMFSHDLMSPLANILGYASLLVEGKDSRLEDRAGAHIARILANAQYMRALLESILVTIRIDAGKTVVQCAPLNVHALIREAVWRNEHLARAASITLEVEGRDDGLRVLADKLKLAQMLDNLISNAIKFSPGGRRVVLAASAGGPSVSIEVRDEGHGIPAEEQANLFRKFSQTSVSARGRGRSTGLGLYIVDQLARLQKGSVQVRSAPGVGSTFTISLPVAPASSDPKS